MAKPLDVDAYLVRIKYAGPRTADYDTLAGILRSHIASIPFESFDVLLGRPIRLDPEALQAKIVANRRGGYCFEHGSLMYAALQAIGLAPVRHASRVVLFEQRHESVRQHMFLTVAIGGVIYVVDPGVGPFACPLPFRWTALRCRRAHRPTASRAKATTGCSTSRRTAKKSRVGSPQWKRNIPSISK